MMSASPKMKRDELLSTKANFTEREYSEWVQKNLFDKGHEAEAKARPIVEEIIGEELYPVTGSDGKLLASFDGLTMLEDIVFEHKLWNPSLAEAVRNAELDPEYYWQLEQQLLVSDAEKVIFVVSDGTRENMVYMWYYPFPGRAEELQRGWRQFRDDLQNFDPAVIIEKPEANVISALPSLSVHLKGEVTETNLPEYREIALRFIESINTDLQTDQDFSDAEEAVKFCKSAEEKLELVKEQALSDTRSIEELFKTMDEIKETLRRKRLDLDKSVKAQKLARRKEIGQSASKALGEAEKAAEAEFNNTIPFRVQADFLGVMKNKRSIAALQSAVNDELARAKIELTTQRDLVRGNLKIINDAGEEFGFLFNDRKHLVTKDPEHLAMVVKSRVKEYEEQQAEQARQQAEQVRQQQLAAEEEQARARQLAEEKARPSETVALAQQESTVTQIAQPQVAENQTTRLPASESAQVKRPELTCHHGHTWEPRCPTCGEDAIEAA